MATRIIFNGQEYPSTDVMPEDVRKSYLQALAQFADRDGNGIPDILEQGKAGNVIGIQHSSITVNGRTYESEDEMPALVRAIYQHAMGQAGTNLLPSASAPARSEPAGDGLIRALDHARSSLERVMQVLLGIAFISILGGAVFLMLNMNSGHRQERLYVVIFALVLLGTVDTQVQRLVRRRTPFGLAPSEGERRYSGISLLLMFGAAVFLIGLAWFLP